MKINDEIYKAAKDKLKKQQEERIYIRTCLEARLCPHCGWELKFERQGLNNKEKWSCKACGWVSEWS